MDNKNEYMGGVVICLNITIIIILIIGGFFICYSTIYFVNVVKKKNRDRISYTKDRWYSDYISLFFYLYNL